MFNLSSLEVFTASGRAFRIEGLSPKNAEELRDLVLHQMSRFQVDGVLDMDGESLDGNENQDLD